jgi:hypothetical protein
MNTVVAFLAFDDQLLKVGACHLEAATSLDRYHRLERWVIARKV